MSDGNQKPHGTPPAAHHGSHPVAAGVARVATIKACYAHPLDRMNAMWRQIRLIERGRYAKDYRALVDAFRIKDQTYIKDHYDPFLQRISEAVSHSLAPFAKTLRDACTYPEDLPITAKIPDITSALKEHQVVIVCGSTGSGKTTQLPKAVLQCGWGRTGRIGCTQPRRLAATALASRFAAEEKVNLGEEVGYKVRFDDKTSVSTVVKFMTDGILLAETASDPLLLQYNCIILDEVHERSLNIDFLLGYLKLLLKRRRDLRVVISSATLESGRISDFFDGAPIIEVEGKLFPIEDVWLKQEDDTDLSEAVANGYDYLECNAGEGDVLVFLPGEKEIRDTADLLEGRGYDGMEILPLYGRLSSAEQNQIFRSHSGRRNRRVILATNVAETSLTIPGIRYVIDTGMVRLSRFNPKSGIQELHVEFAAKASVRQRRGRCGRLRDGVCVHLYGEDDLERADDYTAPEIQRSGLAEVILRMEALKLPKIEEFPFVDPPDIALIREGRLTLSDLGALDKNNKITPLGWSLAELPVGPRVGKMVFEAKKRSVLAEMTVIAAYLSLQEPWERPYDHLKEAEAARRQYSDKDPQAVPSDFISILILWRKITPIVEQSQSALRKFAKNNYLNYRRLREWRNLVFDLLDILEEDIDVLDVLLTEDWTPDRFAIHSILMSALPRQLGMYDREKKCYVDRTGRNYWIFPGSVLACVRDVSAVSQKTRANQGDHVRGRNGRQTPPWILSFAIVDTSRTYARCNAAVDGAWIEKIAPQLCSYAYDGVHWNESSGFVTATERVMDGILPVSVGRPCHFGRIDPLKARDVFIREALVTGLLQIPSVPWVMEFHKTYEFIVSMESRLRRPDSLLNTNAVYRHFNETLPLEVCSVAAVTQHYKRTHRSFAPKMEDLVYDADDLPNADDYPDFLEMCGQKFPLRYVFNPGEKDDGMTLIVRERDLPLLNGNMLSWLVPGHLPQYLDFMLHSLPKNIRKEIMPIRDCIDGFLEKVHSGSVFQDQPLINAVSDYLASEYGTVLSDSDLDRFYDSLDDLPPYLRLRLEVTDEEGKVLYHTSELPDEAEKGSKIPMTHPLLKKLRASKCTGWPEHVVLPEFVPVSPDGTKLSYPALVQDDGGVGVAAYLDLNEARHAHLLGVRQLLRVSQARWIKYLEKSIKISYPLQLTFFADDMTWQRSIMDYAIDTAWSAPSWNIRTKEAFDEQIEHLQGHLADHLDRTLSMLADLYKTYELISPKLNQFRDDSFTKDDAATQLDFLFRPGFLRVSDSVKSYPRYLRSLAIRLDRACSDGAGDMRKGQGIAAYVSKFRLAVDGFCSREKPLESIPELSDFFLLLEEARISAFTPELKTVRKVSPKILADAWEAVHCSV